MDRDLNYVLIAAAVLAIVIGRQVMKVASESDIKNVLRYFIPGVEGFSSTPYWDVKRWSWGYGTASPGATGTINRDQAFDDMMSYLLTDYELLKKRITRAMTANQWAALLSFSYQLGLGNAYNLVADINSLNDLKLRDHWNLYVYVDGKVNQDSIDRRQKEWELFTT